MSTYTRILLQIVFGSKYSVRFLNESNQEKLFSYLAGIWRKMNMIPYAIGGHENHIHFILGYHPSISISKFVKDVKLSSNTLIKSNRELFPGFDRWQSGYGAFSYSFNDKYHLIDYVRNQKEHHQKKTFREELIELLKEFNIEFSEEYMDL